MTDKPHIVLIHGLYMRPIVMRPMARWFESQGYSTSSFGYKTTSESLELNLKKLSAHINAIDSNDLYLLCHSLGGLLARAYLESTEVNKAIRKLVTIGTPHQGAAIARWLKSNNLGALLGQSTDKGLFESPSVWNLETPLGSIAGNSRIGLLPLISDNPEPSDGTVFVSETHIQGETDHIVLPYSHAQLILVTEVFKAGMNFIRESRFDANE